VSRLSRLFWAAATATVFPATTLRGWLRYRRDHARGNPAVVHAARVACLTDEQYVRVVAQLRADRERMHPADECDPMLPCSPEDGWRCGWHRPPPVLATVTELTSRRSS
jgi:hypothetical protein